MSQSHCGRRHAYKEVRLQQLRSLCEVARTGSQAAAAEALGISQPTGWEHVHALERGFGIRLLEPHGRTCRLTAAGLSLVEMATPLVAGFDSLKPRFEQSQLQVELQLTLASSPRLLLEDLVDPLARFVRERPRTRLSILEVPGAEVPLLVASQVADLGVSGNPVPSALDPWLAVELLYETDLVLLTPKDHPLARRRSVTPQDLLEYPLLNSQVTGFADPLIAGSLHRLGAFRNRPPLEAGFALLLRRLVESGLGIALVHGIAKRSSRGLLHERSLGHYFGRTPVNLIWRKGNLNQAAIRELGATVRLAVQPPEDA